MKKLIVFAMGGLLFTSCAKDVKTPTDAQNQKITSVNSTASDREDTKEKTGGVRAIQADAVVTLNKAAADASSQWVLKVNQFEYVVPENLPKEFQSEGYAVHIVYEFTDKKVPCNCDQPSYYVNLLEIKSRYETH